GRSVRIGRIRIGRYGGLRGRNSHCVDSATIPTPETGVGSVLLLSSQLSLAAGCSVGPFIYRRSLRRDGGLDVRKCRGTVAPGIAATTGCRNYVVPAGAPIPQSKKPPS